MVFGSSPRARGTLRSWQGQIRTLRFIPASAGNTFHLAMLVAKASVHPRERGEHILVDAGELTNVGSSPRARGTPECPGLAHRHQRFIPASAGNTFGKKSANPGKSVHPRERGEHLDDTIDDATDAGSSPRARGTRPVGDLGRHWHRFIPASAGNTRWRGCLTKRGSVHPRERGEHLQNYVSELRTRGSSPRARGTPFPQPMER